MVSPRARIVIVLLLLLCPSLGVESASAQGAAGDAIRLYGCSDDMDAQTGRSGSDGFMDCPPDRLRFPAAWIAGASDRFTQATLAGRDQRVDLDISYHPTLWAPAPGYNSPAAGPAVASLADATRGLFDVEVPLGSTAGLGSFDPALWSDEEFNAQLDPEDDADAIDFFPADGRPDIHDRNDGRSPGVDLYVPAFELAYRPTWWSDSFRPQPLPNQGGLALPGRIAGASSTAGQAWAGANHGVGVNWVARPFGIGGQVDGVGAFVSPSFTLTTNDTFHLFDHGIRVDAFGAPGNRSTVFLDITWTGGAVAQTQVDSIPFDVGVSGQVPASIASAGHHPRNVAFVDRASFAREVPDWTSGTPGQQDNAWFVLVERVQLSGAASGRNEVELRIGRVFSEEAPLNVVFVDRQMFMVRKLVEDAGALRALTWAQLVPVQDFRFRHEAIDLVGVKFDARLPIAAPFDRVHVALDDLVVQPRVDRYGFLAETATRRDGWIDRSELGFQEALALSNDRARRAEPVVVHVKEGGAAAALTPLHMPRVESHTAERALSVPFRFGVVQTSVRPLIMHSTVLSEHGVFQQNTGGLVTARGPSAFVITSGDVFRPFVGEVLQLYGATRARAEAADVLLTNPAILIGSESAGLVGQATGTVNQRMDLAMRYHPFFVLSPSALGLLPISDEAIDRAIDLDANPHVVESRRDGHADNLADVAPRNQDSSRADVYAPVIQVQYTLRHADSLSLLPVKLPFDSATSLAIAAASTKATGTGLTSFDINEDGAADSVLMQRFWDVSAVGDAQAHWSSGDTKFWSTSSGKESDIVRLSTPALRASSGTRVSFFDVDATSTRTADGAWTLAIDDGANENGARLVRLDAPGTRACITISWAGEVVARANGDCAGIVAGPMIVHESVSPNHVRAWVDVLSVGVEEVTLRVHRMFAPRVADSAVDTGRFVVAGVAYDWRGFEPHAGGGLAALRLEQLVPLGAAVTINHRGESAVLSPVPLGGRLPLLPPFDRAHVVQKVINPAGVLDAMGFPRAADDETRAVPDLTRVGALQAQVVGRTYARPARFVTFDPALDLAAAPYGGGLFVSGVFAAPLDGRNVPSSWRTEDPARLRTAGPAGITEAIPSAGDEGWDQFVQLDLGSDRGPYLVDSARLSAALPGAVATGHDAKSWVAGRASGFWLFDSAAPDDLYRPRAAISVPTPQGPDVPVENSNPDGQGNNTTDAPGKGGRENGTPAPGFPLAIAALLGLIALARARARCHEPGSGRSNKPRT